jgi:hypothetical protein
VPRALAALTIFRFYSHITLTRTEEVSYSVSA